MIPPAIGSKLAKLIPMLATDHDGEGVATVRAISRTLAAAGSDFHALAAALMASAPNVVAFDWADFAEGFAEASSVPPAGTPDPNAPDQPSTRWGLPIWGVKKIEPWNIVAGHCLQLNWAIPKTAGGKFLTKAEKDRLRAVERYAPVTNTDADWITRIVERCHQVRDVWREDNRKAAA